MSLRVSGSKFEIELEDGFADYFQSCDDGISLNDNNDIKDLLRAYVQKSYDMYCMNNSVETIINKIDIDIQKR